MPHKVARMMPVTQLGTPKYSRVTSATLQVWNMLPPVKANNSSARQKNPPMTFPNGRSFGCSSDRPSRATYMAPPCGFSGSLVSRYNSASVTSVVFSAMPTMPTTHIQNTAPGPPKSTAIAMPAIAPRPTVPDIAAVSAWKCVSAPGPWLVSMPWPAHSATPCVSERYWQNLVHSVNSKPISNSACNTGVDSSTLLMASIQRKNVSMSEPKKNAPGRGRG